MAPKLKKKDKKAQKQKQILSEDAKARNKIVRIARRKRRQDIKRQAKEILLQNELKETKKEEETEEAIRQPFTPPPDQLEQHPTTMKDKPLAVWDSVPVCTTSCVAWEQCPKRIPEDVMHPPKCIIRVKYIKNTLKVLQEGLNIDDSLSLHKVGMMLIPLYSQLCSFKIAEIGMNADNKVLHGGKINPIYKEMRSTIMMINKMLDELNYNPAGKGKRSKKDGKDKEQYGDPDYYDSLFEGEVDC